MVSCAGERRPTVEQSIGKTKRVRSKTWTLLFSTCCFQLCCYENAFTALRITAHEFKKDLKFPGETNG